VVAHNCNSSTWELLNQEDDKDHGQSGLHREFQASLSYIMRPYLKKQQKINVNLISRGLPLYVVSYINDIHKNHTTCQAWWHTSVIPAT
jgi:hypothetical protein